MAVDLSFHGVNFPIFVQNGTLGVNEFIARKEFTIKLPVERQVRAVVPGIVFALQNVLPEYTERYPLLTKYPSFAFILTFGDVAPCNASVPFFSNAARLDCPSCIARPNCFGVGWVRDQWESEQRARARKYPWQTKMTQVVWRGSPTGVRDVGTNQRIRLARLVANHSQFDVGFSHRAWLPQAYKAVPMKPQIKLRDFMKYKAILDIDGNSWSSRFDILLCQNSVIVKVQPQEVGHLYYQVQPWRHYVPVRADFSDLFERVAWVLDPSNERQVFTIINNANAWCGYNMRRDRMHHQWLELFEYYLELLENADPVWSQTWQAEASRLYPLDVAWINTTT